MKQKIFALFLCLAMIANILSLSIYADGRDISDFEIEIETNGELSLEALAGRVLPESDRPEVVSLSSVAANGHVNRLRTQETELSDVIFQNTDGTKTLYRFSYPVKYVDENGNTLDKSNSVSAITVGDTRYGTYAYVNPNNDINTYFPQTLNSAQGISLEWDDLKIEMSPISAAIGEETAAVQTTNAVLSAQAATAQKLSYNADGESKDAVSFNGVFGAATTVRYTPTFDGVKEDIILNSYNGTNRFTFHITTNGLALLQNDDGQYVFTDPESGEIKALLGELVVYDSSDNVDHYMQSYGYNHRYAVSTLEQNNKYAVTVIVDKSFLENDDTVYPVFVDPQLTVWYPEGDGYIQDTTVFGGLVEADDIIDTGTFGKYGLLYVGEYSDYPARALIDFEWLGYEDSRNPLAGASVSSAKLYIRDLFSGLTVNRIEAYGVDPSISVNSQNTEIKTHWRECVALSKHFANKYNTNVHYCGRTVYYGNAVTEIGGTTSGVGFYDFDITTYVRSMLSTGEGPSGTKGIMLKAEYEEREAHIFASKEYSVAQYRPALVVNYTSSIAFSQTSLSVSVDQSVTLGVTASLSDNYDLSSSDTSIATVSWVGTKASQGIRITGKSAGVATIKMYYRSDPSLYVRCTVTVSNQNLLKIYISPEYSEKTYTGFNGPYSESKENEKKNMDNVARYLQNYLSYYYVDTMVNTNVVGSTKKEKYTYRGQIANDVFFVGTATDKRLYLALHTNGGEATYSVAFYNSVGGEKTRGLADALTNAVYPIIPLGTYHTPIAGLYGYNINTNPMVEYDPWVGNLGEIKINEGTYSYYDEYGNLCHSTGYNTPAVLLEIAFHDKPEQTEFLIQSYNEKYIAATIAKSLVEYYNLQPKL